MKRKIKGNESHEHLKSRFSPEQNIKAKDKSPVSFEEVKHEPPEFNVCPEQGIKAKYKSPISIEEVMHEPLKSGFSGRQEIKAKHESPISIEEDKHEEKSSLTIRKKVTFDANVKTYEPVYISESTESLQESIQIIEKQKEENVEKLSLPSYPSNHRYNNCQESDDEVDELESLESYMDDEDSEYDEDEDEDFENYDESSDETMAQEISSFNLREKKMVNPMLNTVDSQAQWKALKTKTKTKAENKDSEVAIDASLSNWLVSSDPTLKKKANFDVLEPISQKLACDDRPILGEVLESKGNYWSSSGMRVKDIGAAFSYKGLPNAARGEVLVK